MDTKKIGQFLAQLRKENGLTQDELGQQLGVTNKTVSRWENGNYLPPAEMLKLLSELYGLTINELLSGQRLNAGEYRQRAEENITAVMKGGNFSFREKLRVIGSWLHKNWWLVLLCLAPGLLGYCLLPFAVRDVVTTAMYTTSALAIGIILICNHVVCHVTQSAYAATKAPSEFHALKIMRMVWLVILGIALFVSTEIGLATLHAMTPAGTADGYAVGSIFYDILISDGGNYLDNCWIALQRTLWQLFAAAIVNIDLTILWMNRI